MIVSSQPLFLDLNGEEKTNRNTFACWALYSKRDGDQLIAYGWFGYDPPRFKPKANAQHYSTLLVWPGEAIPATYRSKEPRS